MPDFPVTLGNFSFQGFEVPAEMPFGGAQALTTHKLIGGTRIIDAMGRDDVLLSWSGTFLSPDAAQRARALDALRVVGAPLLLVWNSFRYLVVIQRFSPIYRHASEVPYRIECEVVQDQTQPAASPLPSPDADFSGSLGDAGDIAVSLSVPVIPTLSTIQQTLNLAGSISGASPAQLTQISIAIGQGQAAVGPVIAMQDLGLGSLPAFGGVIPGAVPAANAASLLAATGNGVQLPQLLQVNNDLTNMSKAIGRLGL